MPITPFHATAFLFLYFKDKRRVDPLALVISTTFIDLEPLYYVILGDPLDHRIWHGFTLALTIYPVLVTAAVYLMERLFENRLRTIYKWARFDPVRVRYPLRNIYLISIFGGFSHVFLDMFCHLICFGFCTPLSMEIPSRCGNLQQQCMLLRPYYPFIR